MTGTYDLAFSLGQACACSMSLRLAGLQFASFPFDWVAEAPLARRVDIIRTRFDHWFDACDFVYDGKNSINGLGNFHNTRTGMHHPHDFPDGPLEMGYQIAASKYDRRTKRLLALLDRSKRVLCVCVDRTVDRATPTTDEELSDARSVLSTTYPGTVFDFIHFVQDRSIPFDQRKVSTPADGIVEVRFDYHHDTKDVCCQSVAEALRSLGIKVRDYRTKAERKAYRRKKKMRKYGVNTRLGLFFAKTKDRLRRLIHGNTATDSQRMQ